MRILISGTSKGIGKRCAEKFLENGFEVIGIDLLESTIKHPKYAHFVGDISKKSQLPNIDDIDYIFNNAGLQNSKDDINNNLVGTINLTEKYMNLPSLKAILFNASASSISGFEFSEYVASKAGIVGYMKNVASRLADRGVLVNAISLGGVISESNLPVMNDKESWEKIMEVTPLKKWTTLDEVFDWVYFLLITNKSMTGQNLLVDNGEFNCNSTFVWPK